jgi:hypothetical protein
MDENGPKVTKAIANLNRAVEQLVRFDAVEARWEVFDRRVAELVAAVKGEVSNG